VKFLIDYSASIHVLNTFGLDPHTNVLTRSPLAQKKKYPSGLRKALALIAAHSAAPQEPATPGAPLSLEMPLSVTTPSEEPPAALSEEEPGPTLRRSTGSSDDFQDAFDPEDDEEIKETSNASTPTVPTDVLVALGHRDVETSNAPSDNLSALAIGP